MNYKEFKFISKTRYTKILKIKTFYRINDYIIFIDTNKNLNVLNELNRKTKIKKKILKLDNTNDYIKNVLLFKNILIIKFKILKHIFLDLKKLYLIKFDKINEKIKYIGNYYFLLNIDYNKYKYLYNYSNKVLDLIKLKNVKNKITQLDSFKQIIVVKINHKSFHFYNKRTFKKLKFNELKENDVIIYFDFYKHFIKIYLKNKLIFLYNWNTFKKLKFIENEGNLQNISLFKKIDNSFLIKVKNTLFILNNTKDLKITELYKLKENDNINLIHYFKIYLWIIINDKIFWIFNIKENKKLHLLKKLKNINYFYEFNNFLKFHLNFKKIWIYDKNSLKQIIINELNENDKITYFKEYNNFYRIQINYKLNLFYNTNNKERIEFDGILKNEKITNINEYKTFLQIEINKGSYFYYKLDSFEKIFFKNFNDIREIKINEKENILSYKINNKFFYYDLINFNKINFNDNYEIDYLRKFENMVVIRINNEYFFYKNVNFEKINLEGLDKKDKIKSFLKINNILGITVNNKNNLLLYNYNEYNDNFIKINFKEEIKSFKNFNDFLILETFSKYKLLYYKIKSINYYCLGFININKKITNIIKLKKFSKIIINYKTTIFIELNNKKTIKYFNFINFY